MGVDELYRGRPKPALERAWQMVKDSEASGVALLSSEQEYSDGGFDVTVFDPEDPLDTLQDFLAQFQNNEPRKLLPPGGAYRFTVEDWLTECGTIKIVIIIRHTSDRLESSSLPLNETKQREEQEVAHRAQLTLANGKLLSLNI